MSEIDNLLSFFIDLPDKPETTVRFFNRGDFHSVLGCDVPFVANEVFKSLNNVKNYNFGDKQVECLHLNKNQFPRLIRDLLLVRQYRVEIYHRPGGGAWTLEARASPGNLGALEDLVYSGEESEGSGKVVMAIKKSLNVVGVALIDAERNVLNVWQLTDEDGYASLECILVQNSPKEVLLPDNCDKTLASVIKRVGCTVTNIKHSQFTMDGLEGVLNRLLSWSEGQSENCSALPEFEKQVACSCLHAAIKYTEIENDEMNMNKFSLSPLTPEQFVHIDSSAAKALGMHTGPGSLFKLFDSYCRTGPGRRLLSHWVKTPLRDVAKINERLEIVEVIVSDMELRTEINKNYLRGLPDLETLARRIARKTSTLEDCYKVYNATIKVKELLTVLETSAGQSSVFRAEMIEPLATNLENMAKFQEMIEEVLDMDAAKAGDFLVLSSFSEDLGALRENINELTALMEKELNKCASRLDLESGKGVKLESNPQLGYFFRSPNKKIEKSIRDSGMRIIDSSKSGIRFKSKELENQSSKIKSVKAEYNSCQKSIVNEILAIASGYGSTILNVSQILAKLDVLTSFSLVSCNAPTPYVRPTVLPMDGTNGEINMTMMRHPVMEGLESISFIPNDIRLDHSDKTFEVITGPNMGGKSTYLRTVGTCAVLAHMGCFVPCDEAKLTVLDGILARVGASDCQMAGVSTFLNEMIETSTILKRATPRSLVLIDELGRGTSTYDGCGIAYAIARHLAEQKSMTLFATHFHEVTQLEAEVSTVRNRHVKAVANDEKLILLYEIVDGPTDRSFGIEVAHAANIPLNVIEAAKAKLAKLEVANVNLPQGEVEEGEKLLLKFFQDLKSQGMDKLEPLKTDLLAMQHPYILSLLA